jgi:hypothetical protein
VVELLEMCRDASRGSMPDLRGVADMLDRLVTHDAMQPVWAALERSDLPHACREFALQAIKGFERPWQREERMTRREHDRWTRQVVEAAGTLAELLRGSALDGAIVRALSLDADAYAGVPRDLREALVEQVRKARFTSPRRGRLVRQLADAVEDEPEHGGSWLAFSRLLAAVANNARHWSPSPGAARRDASAQRRRFMRHLAAFFMAVLGRPCDEFVATVAQAAFDTPDAVSSRAARRARSR